MLTRLLCVVRVVIVGAGSVEFTRNVVADLASYEELHGSIAIVLHDIAPERLAYAQRATSSIIRRGGAGYRVEAHADVARPSTTRTT
jgi:alpha-galactosidase